MLQGLLCSSNLSVALQEVSKGHFEFPLSQIALGIAQSPVLPSQETMSSCI
jgi:hypothetical protein